MKVSQNRKDNRRCEEARGIRKGLSFGCPHPPESEVDEDVDVELEVEVELDVDVLVEVEGKEDVAVELELAFVALEGASVEEMGSSLADVTLQPRTAQLVTVMQAWSALTACTEV